MNDQEKKKIDVAGFDLITVQLVNIAQRMTFIENLYFEFGGEGLGPVVEESVREAARNSLEDVHAAFKALDEHTNIRSRMDPEELEWAFPKDEENERA